MRNKKVHRTHCFFNNIKPVFTKHSPRSFRERAHFTSLIDHLRKKGEGRERRRRRRKRGKKKRRRERWRGEKEEGRELNSSLLYQFSTRVDFAPGGHLAMPGNLSGCHNGDATDICE